jgi:hypothetical protein
MSKKSKRVDGPTEDVLESALDVAAPAAVAPPEPVPAPPAARPPRGEGVIALAVFLRLAGPKPDQMVPFARWAAQKSPRAKTLAAWKAAYTEFMNRPVSG